MKSGRVPPAVQDPDSWLALTLFILLCLVGILLIQIIGHSIALYQQEVAQKLNREPVIDDVAGKTMPCFREVHFPA